MMEGDVKEHDGSLSEGLASYQGHFPVGDCVFECLPSAKERREKTPFLASGTRTEVM